MPDRRRVGAAAALAALVATWVATLAVLVTHLLLLPAALVLATAAVALGWQAAVSRAARRWLWSAAAVACLGVLVLLLVRDGVVWLVAVVAGTAAVAGAAARAALGPPTSDRRARDRRAPAPRRAVLFMNPRSGGGTVDDRDLPGEARRRGAEVVLVDDDLDLAAAAEEAVARGADLLGAAGGDGTQAVVAGVAARHDLPFLCVPAGTRNHFATDLGLDTADPEAALTALHHGVERRIDLGEVNGRTFVNNVSLGVYAAVIRSDGYRERKVGAFIDQLPDLVGPDAPPFDLACDTPGGRVEAPELVLVSNNRYHLRSLGDVGTRTALDRAELGIMVAQVDNAADAAQVAVLSTAGRLEEYGRAQLWTAPSFTVESGSALVDAGLDGEAVELEAPLRFRTQPAALRIRLPPDRPGVRRPRPRLSLATARRLWAIAAGRDGRAGEVQRGQPATGPSSPGRPEGGRAALP